LKKIEADTKTHDTYLTVKDFTRRQE